MDESARRENQMVFQLLQELNALLKNEQQHQAAHTAFQVYAFHVQRGD